MRVDVVGRADRRVLASYIADHIPPLLTGLDPGRSEDFWRYLGRGAN